jgi:hypothetical protein
MPTKTQNIVGKISDFAFPTQEQCQNSFHSNWIFFGLWVPDVKFQPTSAFTNLTKSLHLQRNQLQLYPALLSNNHFQMSQLAQKLNHTPVANPIL